MALASNGGGFFKVRIVPDASLHLFTIQGSQNGHKFILL